MTDNYDFPTAFAFWGKEEDAAIKRVLASGRLTSGPEVAAFEHELAAYHGRRYAIMVNSGSSANLVATAALFHLSDKPLKRGDRALVPAIAWSTTYSPLVQHGLDLILVDVDDGWNADPDSLQGAIDMGSNVIRLVVGCSILGNPAHLDRWGTAAGVLDAHFLNDDCESFGSLDGSGLTTAAHGLMATNSFFFSHQISAIEGGAILTDDDQCAELCRMLRAHGWTRDVEMFRPEFEAEYDFRLMGYNVRADEIRAAVAREQLKKLPGFIKARRENDAMFRRLCASLPVTFPPWNGYPSPFSLHFTINAGQEVRRRLAVALRAAKIDCRLPTGGSFRKHAYGAPWAAQATSRADRIHDTGMFLGNAPWPIPDLIERAVAVMRKTL
jgi:CDP-6-deoxy-D-xylo-4-hexulose-3-dehydrase